MTSMLFKARFKYSSFLRRPTFSAKEKIKDQLLPHVHAHTQQQDLVLTDSWYEVILKIKDLQIPAPALDVLDPLDVLLMQGDLLQGEDLTLVVLGATPD